MTEEFHVFADRVHARLLGLQKMRSQLYEVDASDIYQVYLDAFPEGTNPVYKTNTEHDCSCCKQFLRGLGGVVAINADGTVESLWDLPGLPEPYATVAARLDDFVHSLPITGPVVRAQLRYGAKGTRATDEHGSNQTWNHFYGELPRACWSPKPDEVRGAAVTAAAVLRRGLETLSLGALQAVRDLIKANAIYRGTEHTDAVETFLELKKAWERGSARLREAMVWSYHGKPVARFRNTVIGTLAVDLSDGVTEDKAIASFEAKVAPANYKRPKAAITPRMIDNALATIDKLGLRPALDRRFARLSDVSVNDVLFVDRSVAPAMVDGLRAALLDVAAVATVSAVKEAETAVSITMDAFLADVVPKTTKLELLLTSAHLGNLVSVTAPTHADAPPLFAWDNGFAWDYAGGAADSIQERVKAAGGKIDAKLRVSLAWNTSSDLDLHCRFHTRGVTRSGVHIYYGNRSGVLDVDANAHTVVNNPVENMAFADPVDGVYHFSVHNFRQRVHPAANPFTLELAHAGGVTQYTSSVALPRTGSSVSALKVTVKHGTVASVDVLDDRLRDEAMPTTRWGLTTNQLVRVNTLMLSPNHWEGSGSNTGNKHWLFIVDGCTRPDEARGVYNEFLRQGLQQHRKVLEVLGTQTRCPVVPAGEQLSGLGFSETKHDEVILVASNASQRRAYKVTF